VRAGAGAGKTTNLIAEVYDYYKEFTLKNKREPRVVLTTFTRKATQELRERLMWTAQKKQDYEFLNFVLSKNNLMISTIHGVLQLFLRQFAKVIDLDPGFQLIDSDVLRHQSKIILRGLLQNELAQKKQRQDLLDELSIEELCTLLLRYFDSQLQYYNISGYNLKDFQNSMGNILKDFSTRALKISEDIFKETTKENWQEYAGILKVIADDLKTVKSGQDLDRVLSYLKGAKKPTFIKKNPAVSEETNEALANFKKDFDDLNPALFDEEHWKRFLDFYSLFEDLAKEFSQSMMEWKKQNGKITISDLELLSYSILRKVPEQVVLFSDNFDYWLIDEFQDTSPLQVELLKSLSHGKPRYVVGDPQQSIYFFRGARRQVFDEMQEQIQDQGGELKHLKINYRSDKALMSFVNLFFSAYSADFSPMELGPNEGTHKEVAKIALASTETEQEAAILQHIQNLISQKVPLNQICVLSRNNLDLKKISKIFEEQKIPYLLHSASGFQGRREVLDALSMLKFLLNPHDNFNLIEVLRSPWLRVKDEDIIYVTLQKPDSFWQKFLEYKSEQRFNTIEKLKNYISLSFEIGISQTFETMLTDLGIVDHSFQLDPSGRRESNIWKLLVQLKTEDHRPNFSYIDFVRNKSQSVQIEEGQEDADAVSALEPHCIQLMTVHMSKGLEFDHVIIPFIDKMPKTTKYLRYLFDNQTQKWSIALKFDEDTSSAPLPALHIVDQMNNEELVENDRLLYVAMTRAKKTLFLSTSGATQKKSSWLQKMGILLSPGQHEQEGFSYSVEAGPWSPKAFQTPAAQNQEINSPVMDLKALKKNLAQAVTKTAEKRPALSIHFLQKAQAGTHAHLVFEALKYGKKITDDPELVKAQDYILNLKEVPMKEILRNGFAEWGFVMTKENETLAGQIDLWSKIGNKVWIIDYKTGRSASKEKAFEQLQQYAQALQQYENFQECELVAIYPMEQKFFAQKWSSTPKANNKIVPG
jgi:ATP-dependent helicase/nuclease subunit A